MCWSSFDHLPASRSARNAQRRLCHYYITVITAACEALKVNTVTAPRLQRPATEHASTSPASPAACWSNTRNKKQRSRNHSVRRREKRREASSVTQTHTDAAVGEKLCKLAWIQVRSVQRNERGSDFSHDFLTCKLKHQTCLSRVTARPRVRRRRRRE